MFPAKTPRKVWSPPHSMGGRRSVNLLSNSLTNLSAIPPGTFRGTYNWGAPPQHSVQRSVETAAGDEPREAYCTVEEIQLGKRQSKSPIPIGGVQAVVGRAGDEQQGKEEEWEENHYEDGEELEEDGEEEDGEDSSSSSSSGGGGPVKYESASTKKISPSVPPLPPPLPPPKLPQLIAEMKHEKRMAKRNRLARFWPAFAFLAFCLIMLCIGVLSLWVAGVTKPAASNAARKSQSPLLALITSTSTSTTRTPLSPLPAGEAEGISETTTVDQFTTDPRELARLMNDARTRRHIRMFEVRERNNASAPRLSPAAKPLLLSALSHNGVPVHPLQFQRLLRSLGVNSDTLVLFYDTSPHQLWAHYALWLFRLFGHQHSLLLDWTTANATKLANLPAESATTSTFRAQWDAQQIATFDDLLAKFENGSESIVDIVDAQTEQEFNGKPPPFSRKSASSSSASVPWSAIFGHIRTAESLPVELLAHSSRVARPFFTARGLSTTRPVIVYDGHSSHRAAFVWRALRAAGFNASIYFGAWPEWLVRAPDHLKVIPDDDE